MGKVDKNKPINLGLLLDATDHVVERLGKMIEDNQEKNDRNFAKLGADLQIIKDDIRDLKADTVAQKDFEKLKEKVEHHHPTN